MNISAQPDWAALVAQRDCTAVRELIEGLDEVGHLRVPYARLPKRVHTAFAAEHTTWAEIGERSIAELMTCRMAGDATMVALLEAGVAAVADSRAAAGLTRIGAPAAIAALLGELSDLDRGMLAGRVWPDQPPTKEAVSAELGVYPGYLSRYVPRARARFAELLAAPTHAEVSEHAATLRESVGSYAPDAVVAAELAALGLDPGGTEAQVILHVAGPYARRGDWWETVEPGGKQAAADALAAAFASSPAPTVVELRGALEGSGMRAEAITAYLHSQASVRRFGSVYVRWGELTSINVEAVLHAHHAPMRADAIHAALQPGAPTLGSVGTALSDHRQFQRITRTTWGLRDWGMPEYRGIVDEIGAAIDAAGGKIHLDDLKRDLVQRFPDISARSVHSYAHSLAFFTRDKVVRRRTPSDPMRRSGPLNSVRGAFRNGPKQIRLAVAVNAEVTRGSGQTTIPAFAAALGIGPGQERIFSGPLGSVKLYYRVATTNGVGLGSLRRLAHAREADIGDTLVLVFGLDNNSLDAVRIPAETSPSDSLPALLGRKPRDPVAALGKSLQCRPDEVEGVLRGRGELRLADYVSQARGEQP
ncbi:hypothetical protein A7U43_28500 (plasmid) [Mycobacterium adipatum]|uniref:Uncharacterized protein n=2 Tax=Mycobacterium adipatum TaxID=1682113 RepID=A0A172UX85_9MYCO|nr:hypothetical protein A7U43_28500 [Mycobacterium adipatum]